MANQDIRKGLVPVGSLSNAGYYGADAEFYKKSDYAVALFVGDPIVVNGTANLAKYRERIAGSLPEITIAAAGDGNPISGVIIGFYLPASGSTPFTSNYSPASTEAIALVDIDARTLYEVQADSANVIAATDISANANVVYTHSGNTTTGQSGAELNTASMTTTSTYQLQIMRLINRVDNELGTNAKVLVRINNHSYANVVAGI